MGSQNPSTDSLKDDLAKLIIHPFSPSVGQRLVERGLPKEAVILVIRRDEHHLIRHGNKVLQPKDMLLMVADTTMEGEIFSNMSTQ